MGFDERLRRSRRGPDECWPWYGAIDAAGYGRYRQGTKTLYAHRGAYEALIGPIPPKTEIDHACKPEPCKSCCNPRHLEPVPHPENMARYAQRRRRCKNGHPWTKENIYIRPTGTRACRECRRLNAQHWSRLRTRHRATD